MVSTHRVPGEACPKCGTLLDAATSTGEVGPSPGDLTVCIHCAEVLMFMEGMKLKVVSREEELKLDADATAQLFQARLLISAMKKGERYGKQGPGMDSV